MQLLVYHKDETFLADVRTLKQYVLSELNLREIVFTSDEGVAGVRYKAVADWPVLGKKLRANVEKVKASLHSIPSDQVKTYMTTGSLFIDGVLLEAGDLTVQPYIEPPPNGQYGTHTDGDVALRLDVEVHAELVSEWLAREVINRIQKLRKKSGLQATDNIDVHLCFGNSDVRQVRGAVTEYEALITRTTGSRPVIVDSKPALGDRDRVGEEKTEIAGETFTVYLARP